eukprot:8861590-Pyramimonas_sp.AAC.1
MFARTSSAGGFNALGFGLAPSGLAESDGPGRGGAHASSSTAAENTQRGRVGTDEEKQEGAEPNTDNGRRRTSMDGDWDPFDQLEQDAGAFATASYDGDPEPDTPHNDTDEAVCQVEALKVKPYAQAPQEQAKASRDRMK